MCALLQVQDLSVNYRASDGSYRAALDRVCLSVEPGEIVGVLGESGCGKSTLAQALLRVLSVGGQIQQGTIYFRGLDLLSVNKVEMERIRGAAISLIFQEPSIALHPTMRAGEQVAAVIRAHERLKPSECRERARRVLADVFTQDADRIFSSYAHQLSGGQRQRVLIAQAIACRPSLLIADEPTASLDTTTQDGVLTLFAELRQHLGLSVLLITHNPALLAAFADRILVLYAGRVVEQGPAHIVLNSPQHPYTRALLRSMPAPFDDPRADRNKLLPVISGNSPLSIVARNACSFEPRCEDRMPECARAEPWGVVTSHEHVVHCLKYED
jgi:oligopeptide/dipeptide ABC transporter ATP-binding protein